MRISPLLILVLLLPACSWKPQVWTDEESGLTIVAQRLPASPSDDDLRHATAGFVEGLLEDGTFLPEECGAVTIHTFPGIYFKGSGQSETAGLRITAMLIFGQKGNYLIQCVGPEYAEALTIEAHVVVVGSKNPIAETIVSEMARRFSEGIPELRRNIESQVSKGLSE